MKIALIVGSEGQDGTLLKRYLSSKGYEVWGLGRKENTIDSATLKGYLSFNLYKSDYSLLADFITKKKPQEIYYVAAFHHSSQDIQEGFSDDFIDQSIAINQSGFIKILDIIRAKSPETKIFYTSSSLIFSGTAEKIQNEQTAYEPRCIYSVTKCAAMHAAKFYRETYDIFVSTGIMYNHESSLRSDYFLSKKIINETHKILEGKSSFIEIGDLSAVTDWGYAPDYVDAMWHILQLQDPGDYIIASGQPHSVQNWFEVLFGYLNMDWRQYVRENKSLIVRQKPILIGNPEKLLSTGWMPRTGFSEIVINMFENKI